MPDCIIMIITITITTTIIAITTSTVAFLLVALPDGLGGDAHVVVLRELGAVQHGGPANNN